VGNTSKSANKKVNGAIKKEDQGNQYRLWQKNKHFGAYHTLATPEAPQVARIIDLKDDPKKSPKC